MGRLVSLVICRLFDPSTFMTHTFSTPMSEGARYARYCPFGEICMHTRPCLAEDTIHLKRESAQESIYSNTTNTHGALAARYEIQHSDTPQENQQAPNPIWTEKILQYTPTQRWDLCWGEQRKSARRFLKRIWLSATLQNQVI